MSIVKLHANFSYSYLFIILFYCIYSTCTVLAKTKHKICGDPKCTKVLSHAKTLGKMNSRAIGHLSFERGQEVKVMGKTLRESHELWDVFFDGKRGFIPKSFLRETNVFIRNPKDIVTFEMKQPDEAPVIQPPHTTAQQHPSSAGQQHPSSAGQQHASSAGQQHASSAGQQHPSSAGQQHASSAGQQHASSAGQQAASQQQVPAQASVPVDKQTLQPPSDPSSSQAAGSVADEGTDLTEDDEDEDADADDDDDYDNEKEDDTEMDDESEEEDDTEILDNPDFDVDTDEPEVVENLHKPQEQQQQQKPQDVPEVVAPIVSDTPVDSSLTDTPGTLRQPEGVPDQGDDKAPEEQNKAELDASQSPPSVDYKKIREKATQVSLDQLRESLQKRRVQFQSMDTTKELEDLNAFLASKQTDGTPMKKESTIDEHSVMDTGSTTEQQQPELLSVTGTMPHEAAPSVKNSSPHQQPQIPELVDITDPKVVEGQPDVQEGQPEVKNDQEEIEPEQPMGIGSKIQGVFHSVMSTVLGGQDVVTDKPSTTETPPDEQVNTDNNLHFVKDERLEDVSKEEVIMPLVHDMDRHVVADMDEATPGSQSQDLYADITEDRDKVHVETADEKEAEQLSLDSGHGQYVSEVRKVLDAPSSPSVESEEMGESKRPIATESHILSVDMKIPTDRHPSDTKEQQHAAESMQLAKPAVDIPGSPASGMNQHIPEEAHAASVDVPHSDIPSEHGAGAPMGHYDDVGGYEDHAGAVSIEPTPSLQQSGVKDQQHQTKLGHKEYMSYNEAHLTEEKYTIIEGTRFLLDDEADMVYASQSIVASTPVFADPVTITPAHSLSEKENEELKVNLFKNAAVDVTAQRKDQHRNEDNLSHDSPSQSQNITQENMNEPKVESVEVKLPDLSKDTVYATADFMSRKPLSHETTSAMYEPEDGVPGKEEGKPVEEQDSSNEPNDDKSNEFLAGNEENAVEDSTGFYFNEPSATKAGVQVEDGTDDVIDDGQNNHGNIEETQDVNQEPDDAPEDKETDHIARDSQNDVENGQELNDNDDEQSQMGQRANGHIDGEPPAERKEPDHFLLHQTTERPLYEQVEPASPERVPSTPSYADTVTPPTPIDTPETVPAQEEAVVTKDANNNKDINDPYMTDSEWSQKISDPEAEDDLYQSAAHKMVKNSMGTMASGMNWLLTKLPLSIQSFLEHEPMGLSPQMSLMAVITTFATVVITTCCSCVCHSKKASKTKKKDPSSVIRGLEEKLFIATKEKETLEDALTSTEKKMLMMDAQLCTLKKSSVSQKADLQTSQIHNESLKTTLTSLQEHFDELKGVVAQRDMIAQQQAEQMASLQMELSNSQLTTNTLEAKYQQSCYEVTEQQSSVDQMHLQTEALNEHVQHLEARKLQLSVEAEEWEKRVNDLNETLSQLREDYKQMEETVTFKENELQLLRDCFVQLKTFEDHETVEDDQDDEFHTETVDNTKSVQEKLKTMMDVSVVNAALKGAEEERDSLKNKLQIEAEARKEMEDQIEKLKKESDSAQLGQSRAERQCQDATTRLNVLSSYFKEKEVELQKELGEQEVMKKKNATMLETADEETRLMHEELISLRDQVSSMKNEISLSEKDYRGQIAANEKKAHENWLAARKSDREAKEARHEASVLRQKLMDLERRQTSGLLRPLPTRLPPPGLPNGAPPPPIPYDPPPLPVPGDRSPSRSSMLGYRDDDPHGSPLSGMRPPPMRRPHSPLLPSPPPFDRRLPPPRDLRSPPRDYPDMPSPPHLDSRRPMPPPQLLDRRSPPLYMPPPPPHGFLRGPPPPPHPHLMRRERGDPLSPLDVRESERLGDPRTSSPYDPPQHRDRPPPPRELQSHV